MNRSIIYILFTALLSMHITGCSLFGSSSEEDSAEISQDEEFSKDEFEAGEGDAAEGEEISDDQFADSDTSADVDEISDLQVEGEAFTDEEFSDDEFPDDDAGAEIVEEENLEDLESGEFAVGDDSDEIPNETLTENEEQDLFSGGEEVVSSGEVYEDITPGDNYVEIAKTYVSVKKMKPAAFRRAGANVNRLYVVRSGDSMSSIARKIYGSDKSTNLYSWNSHFRGKSIKVGDKIYYSSPRNPADSSMKTYYEDGGVNSQFYSARPGDNIRSIAKKLLGHERSWMEIYATNPSVQTKGRFSSSTQLRYWQGAAAPAPMAVAADEAADEDADEDIDEDIDELEESDPTEDIASSEENDDEFEDADEEPSEVAMGGSDEPEEDFGDLEDEPEIPPPVVGKVAPRPPSPPSASNKAVSPPPPMGKKVGNSLSKFAKQVKSKVPGAKIGGKNDTKIMGLLGALMLIVGIVVVVFLRRSRSKRVNFTHTQV